jgi:hypothetical protein
MNAFISFDLFIIYQNSSNSQELWNNTRRYEILHTLKRCCTVYLLLSESSAKINDLDVILHGLILNFVHNTFNLRLHGSVNSVRFIHCAILISFQFAFMYLHRTICSCLIMERCWKCSALDSVCNDAICNTFLSIIMIDNISYDNNTNHSCVKSKTCQQRIDNNRRLICCDDVHQLMRFGYGV